MHISETLKVPAQIDHLSECIQFVSSCARRFGLDQRGIHKIVLSTEEALVNIFKYAYKNHEGDVQVDCMSNDEREFIVEIRDCGVPFNMLKVEDPEVQYDLSNNKIGGLGIFIIKSFMDDVRYRREADMNVLTLVTHK
jgi:serine/threonine-protein kinase RsbW